MIIYHTYNSAMNSVTPKPEPKTVLRVIHNAGFFSCFTIRLMDILKYFNTYKEIPDEVDSSEQFSLFRSHPGENLGEYYFSENKSVDIDFDREIPYRDDCMAIQFAPYGELDHKALAPFIKRYFTPSENVGNKVFDLQKKYQIDPASICGVFYRGNDKIKECDRIPYEVFIEKAREIESMRREVRFLLLPDEIEFEQEFKRHFPYNTITLKEVGAIGKTSKEAVFHKTSQSRRKEREAYYNAAVYLLAKSAEIITHSGNGGLWAALYRGNSENIHQYFNGKWIQ